MKLWSEGQGYFALWPSLFFLEDFDRWQHLTRRARSKATAGSDDALAVSLAVLYKERGC